MNKLLFEQPKLTVESFSAKEDILFTSGFQMEYGLDETNWVAIAGPAITGR